MKSDTVCSSIEAFECLSDLMADHGMGVIPEVYGYYLMVPIAVIAVFLIFKKKK